MDRLDRLKSLQALQKMDPFALGMQANKTKEAISNHREMIQNNANTFFDNFKPNLYSLILLGVFPIYRTKTGEMRFQVLSLVTLYSICLYGGFLYLFIYINYFTDETGRWSGNMFDKMVVYIFQLCSSLMQFCIPFANWPEANKLTSYLQNWGAFQVQFRAVTGDAFRIDLRRRVWLLWLMVPIAPFAVEVIPAVVLYPMTPGFALTLLSDWHLAFLKGNILVLWYVVSAAPRGAVGSLGRYFEKSFQPQTGSVFHFIFCIFGEVLLPGVFPVANPPTWKALETSEHPARTITEYRLLWMKLSELTRQSGTVLGYTILCFIFYILINLTLNIYFIFSMSIDGVSSSRYWQVIEVIFSLTYLFVICNEANKTTHKVGTAFQQRILPITAIPAYQAFNKEMDLFLRTIDMTPPIISPADFVVINRQTFISIGATMVTYLVVLMQFKVSSLSSCCSRRGNPAPSS